MLDAQAKIIAISRKTLQNHDVL